MSINNYCNYKISYLDNKNKRKKGSYYCKLSHALHELLTSILHNKN